MFDTPDLGLQFNEDPYYLTSSEVLEEINILCKNPLNEKYFPQIIPLLIQYLQQNFVDKLQNLTAECILSLTFYENCKQVFKKQENLNKLLNLKKNNSIKTFQTIQNILWN